MLPIVGRPHQPSLANGDSVGEEAGGSVATGEGVAGGSTMMLVGEEVGRGRRRFSKRFHIRRLNRRRFACGRRRRRETIVLTRLRGRSNGRFNRCNGSGSRIDGRRRSFSRRSSRRLSRRSSRRFSCKLQLERAQRAFQQTAIQ